MVLLFVSLAAAASGQRQTRSPFVLNGLGRATLPLDGDWQFHEGDDLAWSSPGYDDSAWQPIQVGRSWEGQGHRNYTGFAWYRRRLVLPAGRATGWTLAVYLPNVESACEVYWNGVKKGAYGKLPPDPVWYGFGRAHGGVVILGPVEAGELAIRVWKAPIVFLNSPEEGGLIAVPQVGSTEAIDGLEAAAQYQRLKQAQFSLSVARIGAAVGLAAFLLWLRKRRQLILLWLTMAMIYPTALYLLVDASAPVPFRVAYALIGPLVAINDIAMWFLLIALLGLSDRKRLVRWTWIIALTTLGLDMVDTVCQFFDWTTWPPHLFATLDAVTTVPVIYMELWGLVLVFAAFGKRLDPARWVLAIAALLSTLLVALGDATGLGRRWTNLTISQKLHAPLFTIGGTPLTAQVLVSAFVLLAILYSAWRYSEENSQRQSALEQELRNARAVQQVLIPDVIPAVSGFRVESAYKPAGEVGGDFFQILPTADDGLLVVVGDVSGKGIPAAMTVALIVGTVRTLAGYTRKPAEILTALNKLMLAHSRGGFTTCLVMRAESNGSITGANAGHLPPYRNGEEIHIENGLPLGLVADAEYAETEFHLEPQDTLTMLSDGVVEARNQAGELFGFERTQTISREPAETIARAAQAFGHDDDITVVTLTLLPAAVLQA